MTMTFDVGPPKEFEPDWEELKIDALAKKILEQVPEEMIPTTLRAICNGYDACNKEMGSSKTIKFLGADNGEDQSYECTIRDTEDYDGNLDGALIEGSINLYNAGIEISANNVMFKSLPSSIAADLVGKPISTILDFPLFSGREIESIKRTDDAVLISLKREEPVLWNDAMEGWE